MKVTVFGGRKCTDEVGAMAEELGRLLAQAGHIVVTGGYGGVMEAVSKGARRAGGVTIGFVLMGVDEPNMFVRVARGVATYWQRLGALMEEGDVYVVLPGESGTMTELLAALHTQARREKLMPGSPKKDVIFLCADNEETVRISEGLCVLAGEEVVGLLLAATTPQAVVAYLNVE